MTATVVALAGYGLWTAASGVWDVLGATLFWVAVVAVAVVVIRAVRADRRQSP